MTWQEQTENGDFPYKLKSGYSVMIPALHFALLYAQDTGAVFVAGWDMQNHSHWNRSRKRKKFPQAQTVMLQALDVQNKFQNPAMINDPLDKYKRDFIFMDEFAANRGF